MSVAQAEFIGAVLDAARPVPDGLRDGAGRPAGKRFAVYRNNVAVSLTEALETGFPVIRKLVGDAFFKAMAGVYLRAHPPASPLMMHYGAEMPAFLQGFGPAQSLPYLADVARLELALRRAYHAADAAPLDPARLGAVPPEDLGRVRLSFAPAVTLVASRFPVHAIWRANTDAAAPRPVPGAEAALVVRPALDPKVLPLDPAAGAVTAALMAGRPLADALEDGPGADLGALLSLLLAHGAVTGLDILQDQDQ